MRKAFSLVEIVVALGLFAILATTISTLLLTTLRGARKSAAIGIVKNEAQTAMTSMAQTLRFAQSVDCSVADQVTVVDQNGGTVVYQYQLASTRIMRGLVALTSPNSVVSRCGITSVFICSGRVVDICFTADAAGAADVTTQAEGATGIRFEARVTLRNYGN